MEKVITIKEVDGEVTFSSEGFTPAEIVGMLLIYHQDYLQQILAKSKRTEQ